MEGAVADSSENRLYKHIKDSFTFEQYLDMPYKSLRVAISKLRLSSHLFLIERGRWGNRRLTLPERKCTLCGVIEDEFHCLIECPRYMNARRGCVPDRLKRRASMFDFVNFIKCQNVLEFKKLGLLCLKVMKEHKRYV